VRVGHRQALILKTPAGKLAGVFFRLKETEINFATGCQKLKASAFKQAMS
jgi:hypothetical protein